MKYKSAIVFCNWTKQTTLMSVVISRLHPQHRSSPTLNLLHKECLKSSKEWHRCGRGWHWTGTVVSLQSNKTDSGVWSQQTAPQDGSTPTYSLDLFTQRIFQAKSGTGLPGVDTGLEHGCNLRESAWARGSWWCTRIHLVKEKDYKTPVTWRILCIIAQQPNICKPIF